jgi:hypothetical protein
MRLAIKIDGPDYCVYCADTGEKIDGITSVEYISAHDRDPRLMVEVEVLNSEQRKQIDETVAHQRQEEARRALWATSLAGRLGLTFDGMKTRVTEGLVARLQETLAETDPRKPYGPDIQ